MEQALISVIVPVYNVEKYLPECVESIISQTYDNLEVILIDDGSTDRSGKICDEFAEKDSRIVVIHQKNSGVSAARNRGLDLCRGEYISFVDSDDYYCTDLMESAMNSIPAFTPPPPDLFEFPIQFVNCSGVLQRTESSTLRKNVIIDKTDIHQLIIPGLIHTTENSTHFGAWVTNKLFKRAIIEKNHIRFDNSLTLWEDGIFTIEFIKYAESLISLDTKGYYYRDTPCSLSEKHEGNIYNIAFSIYSKYHRLFSDEYNFGTTFAKQYRFELVHGITMREFKFMSDKSVATSEIRKTIKSGFYNKSMRTWLYNRRRNNPFFFVIEILLRLGFITPAITVYHQYYRFKTSKT